jgi:Na+-transporting methylmalonyl-CoA/oxaloacetate decarboxylase beta subunit
VYALLCHVIVRYYNDIFTVVPGFAGILIYIPFTHTLLKKFKAMAYMPTVGKASTIQGYIIGQRGLLKTFLTFKKRYEVFLIPLSCAIGVLLTFKLYVPGGIYSHPQGATITFGISLVSCYLAIKQQNERNLVKPITDLDEILQEYAVSVEQK